MRATVEHRDSRDKRDTSAHADNVVRVRVGRTNDPAEAAADEMAQRAQSVSADYRSRSGSEHAVSPRIRRSMAGGGNGDPAMAVDRSALDHAATGGQPLGGADRDHLESSYGTSLADVKLHTGSEAASLARSMNAAAFTSGNDIYFDKGQYRPETEHGAHVLAHEVAHTVQNAGGGADGAIHRFPNAALTGPVPWRTLTGDVFRPGEGISGGVYILTSNDPNGEIKKIVAKPIYSGKNGIGAMESPEAVVAGDSMMAKLFGMKAPSSRIAKKGTAEYGDLLAMCLPHAAERDTRTDTELLEAGAQRAPYIEDCDAFVVMGAIEGKSVASMAKGAATDTNSFDMLQRTMFSPAILQQMGRLAIADMMLGNKDRIGAGAMNLGNMMVSATNGQLDLWAIDTLAALPKYDPKQFSDDGIGGGFSNNFSKDLAAGPGRTLDGVFETVISLIERGIADDVLKNSPAAPHTVLRQRYGAEKNAVLAHFARGWEGGLTQAATYSARIKERDPNAARGNDPDNLTTGALRANITYLGGLANGGSAVDAQANALAEVVKDYVRDLDIDSIAPPSDALSPMALTLPSKDVRAAEVPDTPALTVASLKALKPAVSGRQTPVQKTSISTYAAGVTTAHNEVNNAVEENKTRRKGISLKKVVLPRNRNLIGHFIVDAKANTAGAFRAVAAVKALEDISVELAVASKATYKKGTAGNVISTLKKVDTLANRLRPTVAAFSQQAAIVAQVAPIAQMTNRAEFSALQGSVAGFMTKADAGLTTITKAKLCETANIIAKAN